MPMRDLQEEAAIFREPGYREGVFSDEDPWGYDSDYETKKYEQTLSLVPGRGIERATEIACGEGHFTARLAPLVGTLAAFDISPTALQRARWRCAGISNVEFGQLDLLRGQLPRGQDLIVCSEVLYYFEVTEVSGIVAALASALRLDGHLITAHSNVVRDDRTSTGFDRDHSFGSRTIGEIFAGCREFSLVKELRTPLYSIRLYRRTAGPEGVVTPLIVHLPIEVPLSVRLEKGIVWGGSALTRAEASEQEKAVQVPILAYHSVAEVGPPELSQYRVTPRMFEEQMRFLRRHGFHSVSLAEWRACLDGKRALPGRPVVITFDDGYCNFKEHAWPILERADFTATVFVVPQYVGESAEWDRCLSQSQPDRLMDWSELAEMVQCGVEIQSHTMAHRDLLTLSSEEITHDGSKARAELEQRLRCPVYATAFPYGRGDANVGCALAQAGYTIGLNTVGKASTLRDNPMDLPRIQVDANDDLASFAQKVLSGEDLQRLGNASHSNGVTTEMKAALVPAKPEPPKEAVASLPSKVDWSLSARLDKLIGDFVALQVRLLESTEKERALPHTFRQLFTKPVVSETPVLLKPYDQIAANIHVGFEEPARVQFQLDWKRDHSVSPESHVNSIGLSYRGPSRWLTLEVPLDWREVSSAQSYQFSIYAEPSRAIPLRVVIRYTFSRGENLDVDVTRLELGQHGRQANRAGKLTHPDLLDVDTSKAPRLLIFFHPEHDFSIRIHYMNLYFC